MKKIVLTLILIFVLVYSGSTVVRANGINNFDKKNHSYKEKINTEDFYPYIKTVERKIRENWDPPKNKQDFRTIASFKINKDGTLNGVKILKSSGDENYDNAAILAISKSSPFKTLPVNFKGNYAEIEFHFDYHVAR